MFGVGLILGSNQISNERKSYTLTTLRNLLIAYNSNTVLVDPPGFAREIKLKEIIIIIRA